jgi:hypothetical protein
MGNDDDQEIRLEDVLDGTIRIDISHDGGELREAIWQEIEEEARRKQYAVRNIADDIS